MDIKKTVWVGGEWIHLFQDKKQQHALGGVSNYSVTSQTITVLRTHHCKNLKFHSNEGYGSTKNCWIWLNEKLSDSWSTSGQSEWSAQPILTVAGYTGTVATPASAEQVCSVQYPSGTPQMLGQLPGPDPPDNGTSTLPVSTQKYTQIIPFRCHAQLLWECGLLSCDKALGYQHFQETCCPLLQDIHSSKTLQSPIIPHSVMPTNLPLPWKLQYLIHKDAFLGCFNHAEW